MVRNNAEEKIQAQWLAKSVIGAVLGFTLALFLVGMFAWQGFGGIDAANKVQFNMWLIVFLWLCIFSIVYLFKTALRAFNWLMALNIIALSFLMLIKQ